MNRRTLTFFIALLGVAVALSYGLFEGRKLIEGPQISIISPRDGQAVGGPLISVKGTAENVAFLSVNGKQAYADADGNFVESFSMPVGYTVIAVNATDRFGRKTAEVLHLTVVNFCPITG